MCIQEEEISDLSIILPSPDPVIENLSVTLSKGTEIIDQWLFRNLMFSTSSDDSSEQCFSTGDLVEYKNYEGFLNGRAIFLCVTQQDRQYKPPYLRHSIDVDEFYVSSKIIKIFAVRFS